MSGRIIDVQLNVSGGGVNVRDEIVKGLSRPVGQKALPQLLLYDEEGLHIYDEITTHSEEYYLFRAEETLLKKHAYDIVQIMQGQHGDRGHHPIRGVVLELGAGWVCQSQTLHKSSQSFSHFHIPSSLYSRLAYALITMPLWSVVDWSSLGVGMVLLIAACALRWK